MDVLTSTPVLLLALWAATVLVLRLCYVVQRREREREQRWAAGRKDGVALDHGTPDLRVTAVVVAVVSVAAAVVLSWHLLTPGPDREEFELIVTEAVPPVAMAGCSARMLDAAVAALDAQLPPPSATPVTLGAGGVAQPAPPSS